jgi:hypothetical protein
VLARLEPARLARKLGIAEGRGPGGLDRGSVYRWERGTGEKKSLASKLSAARDNVRFADKRIADLEAQLVSAMTSPSTAGGQR